MIQEIKTSLDGLTSNVSTLIDEVSRLNHSYTQLSTMSESEGSVKDAVCAPTSNITSCKGSYLFVCSGYLVVFKPLWTEGSFILYNNKI